MSTNKGKSQPVGLNMTRSRTRLGRFIRARRLKLDIRQTPLAKSTGVDQRQISMLETGKRQRLNPKRLERLAEALQCDPEDLRKRIPAKHVAQPTTVLGKLVRKRREEIGLSPGALARKMRMTLKQVRKLEIRKAPSIHPRFGKKLARALNLDLVILAEFLGWQRKPTSSKLGRFIRKRRRELGMNGSELAKKLHVSRQFVDQIELGKCSLSGNDKRIEQLAKLLKLDIRRLQAVRVAIGARSKLRKIA